MTDLVIVDRHTPHHTVTPWDVYGRLHCDGWRKALADAGLPAPTIEVVNNDIELPHGQAHPLGSGPGCRVRFGDGMRPSTYIVRVPAEHAAASREAYAVMRQRRLAELGITLA